MAELNSYVFNDHIWLMDTALYHVDQHTLILTDLHLGYEEAMRRGGLMLPETHLSELIERIKKIFDTLNVSVEKPLKQLILNGDLRHTFGPLNEGEWRELNAFFEAVTPYATQIVVIEGNHDPAMNVFGSRFPNIRIAQQHQMGSWLFTHGDQIPSMPSSIDTLVIGHEHPALSLQDPVTGRQERYKVFLKGAFEEKTLWVLPSCNTLLQGTDLSKEGVLSPFLKEGVWQQCEVFVRDDAGQIYPFGLINQLL